jgi:putative endonuclease
MPVRKFIVYILRSEKYPQRIYIGFTEDLDKRIGEHNRNESGYTKSYSPWSLETYIVFNNKSQAVSFEKYLKSGSGFAFLKKRLLTSNKICD